MCCYREEYFSYNISQKCKQQSRQYHDMNRIYKIIWNHGLQCWTAVSELGRSKMKAGKSTMVSLLIASQSGISLAVVNDAVIITDKKIFTENTSIDLPSYGMKFNQGSGLFVEGGTVTYNLPNTGTDQMRFDNSEINVSGERARLFSKGAVLVLENFTPVTISNGGQISVYDIWSWNNNSNISIDNGTLTLSNPYGFLGSSVFNRVTITNAGKLYAARPEINSKLFTLSGSGSELVSTSFKIGISGNAELSDYALMKTPEELFIGEDLNVASLTIGGISEPKSPGRIDAKALWLGPEGFSNYNASLTFNHTDSQYDFSTPVNGVGHINITNGTTLFSGNNSGFGGALNIQSPAQVIVKKPQNLGASYIENDGVLKLFTEENEIFSNDIGGSGNIDVNSGAKDTTVTLSGDNSSFSGFLNIGSVTRLIVREPQNIGSARVANNGVLKLLTDGDYTFSNNISGSGHIDVDTFLQDAVVTFSGYNKRFTGALDIYPKVQLFVSKAESLSDADITDNGVLKIHVNQPEVFSNNISGTGDIYISSDSQNNTVRLNGNNTGFSGKLNITSPALLFIRKPEQLGNANITSDGTLYLSINGSETFCNNISGQGKVSVDGFTREGFVTLSGNNSEFNGILDIKSHGWVSVSNQSNLGSSNIISDGGGSKGSLNIISQNDWIFSNTMSGSGRLYVRTDGHAFSFRNSTDTQGFTGPLTLADTTFSLSGDNTAALSSSYALQLDAGSVVNVGAGIQNINRLVFNGGEIDFGKVTPGKTQSDNMINVTNRGDIGSSGTVRIDTSGNVISDTVSRGVDTSLPLLEQDDKNASIKLISVSGSDDVTGYFGVGGLQLKDQTGQSITDNIQYAVTQNGQKVAEGTYDYRLTSGINSDGMYIGYGLTQLDLLTSGTDALVLDADGKSGSASDMSARITGSGDLAFSNRKGESISLSGKDNNYTGITDVRSGNLQMNNDNVLGKTSELHLSTDTMLDMNGHNQTVGKLDLAAGSVLNINGGHLTLAEGGVSSGTLTGNGSLNINDGMLYISGANNMLTADTTIAKEAVVQMDNGLGLGNGDIDIAGILSVSDISGALGNNLSGTGTVGLNDSDAALTGNNSHFSGIFTVGWDTSLTASSAENLGKASVDNRGTLVLNSETDWQLANDISGSGNVRKTGFGSLTVRSNAAAWAGQTDIDVGSLILGKADAPVILASSLVNIAENGSLSGYGGVAGNVVNSGIIDLTSGSPGNVLTIGGNYIGNNGVLLMNTVLGDDSSATDKLVIKGNASGNTQVTVNNAGGSGAQTLYGIELIHVDGNADNAEFVRSGRIAAGAYDYTLGRGQGSNRGNWYLTSSKNSQEPLPAPEPGPAPLPGVPPVSGQGPASGGYDNDLRPEAGSYTANMDATNTMFVTRLHERQGPEQYTDIMTGERKTTSMWMHHEGGHKRWRDGTGQLKIRGNRYVLQMGGDLSQWSLNGTDRWHLGVMAGYGSDHNNTDSVRTGYSSKGSVKGYNTGLYATWYANDETHNGAYLDTWILYSWFDNYVKGDGLPGESWKSNGLTASLETGYTWKTGEFTGGHGSLNEWYVQPQAQVVRMGVKADEHRESNGTRVESTGDGNVRTRLGVKTWIQGHNIMDDGKSREFRPFVEVNWLYNTRDFGTRMNGVAVHQNGARNIGEVKAGVEGQINNHLNLWGNVGVQVGDRGYSDTSAVLGIKFSF